VYRIKSQTRRRIDEGGGNAMAARCTITYDDGKPAKRGRKGRR
jgi:hypothetical protein